MLSLEPRQGFLFGTDPSPKGTLLITGPGFYAHGRVALIVDRVQPPSGGVFMRLPWSQHSISVDHMPDKSPATVARLSRADLATYTAGWAPGTSDRLVAEAEQRRREASSARRWSMAAVIIAAASLLVSLCKD